MPITALVRHVLLFEEFQKICNNNLSNGLQIRHLTIRPLQSPGTHVQIIDRIFILKCANVSFKYVREGFEHLHLLYSGAGN
jgi:hypothetical protein